jgi:hypothetical protein
MDICDILGQNSPNLNPLPTMAKHHVEDDSFLECSCYVSEHPPLMQTESSNW